MSDVNDVYGAWYIGQQLATLLLGASIVQSWIYLKNYQQDPWHLKIVVLALLVLGVMITILVSSGLYQLLVTDIGQPPDPSALPWTLRAGLFVISPIIIALVQCFYAYRLLRLTKNVHLFVLILALAISPLPLGFTVSAVELGQASGLISNTQSGNMAIAALVLMMVCDAVIAIAMVYWLYTHRSGIRSTENLMSSLTNYTIASGFTTFLMTCVVLATYLALPQNQIYSGMSFLLSHLYVNSFLAMLNARRSLRRRTSATTSLAVGERAQAEMPPFFSPWDARHDTSTCRSASMEFELATRRTQGEHVLNLQYSHAAPSDSGTKDESCQKPKSDTVCI